MASPCDPNLIYDPALARNPDGTCRCCGWIAHQDRCPLALIEKMTLRVRLGSDRYATEEANGANPERIARKFMDPETGYSWESRPDSNDIIRVSLVMDLPNLEQDVRAAMKRVRVEVEARREAWRIEELQEKRKKALLELANQSDSYTPLGIKRAREAILNDRQYKDLPPIE